MLFNSFTFLLLFLPITAIVYFVLARRTREGAAAWLALASLAFYGWWSLSYIPLLLASIVFNYSVGQRISAATGPARKRWLVFALAADLALLGYFKYADFFISGVNQLTATEFPALHIVLPVGISFFTFTQIAYLVDTYQGKVNETNFLHYLLFITYFPHLIAGPVLHHAEMMPQFGAASSARFSSRNLAVGLSIFTIGLAKKVLIADNLAPHATFLFDQSDMFSLIVAWGGVLAYAFQLYFDFSGYSDMAIGISLIFGIRLPLNFDSPYKSANIIEFWRRWHMTLSRFLRDYLYVPLGGNRKGPVRRYVNLLLTMLLGGLWHGAGLNFVIWGALHGLYLVINHTWHALATALRFPRTSPAWTVFSIGLTFASVCVAWVFFRASDVGKASTILRGMAGGFGIGLPEAIGMQLGSLRPLLEQWGITFYLGGGSRFLETWQWIVVASVIAFLFPNTQQIMARYEAALQGAARPYPGTWHIWRPSRRWSLYIGAILFGSLLSLSRPAEFLYFQF
ncbi:MBOAT family protein [Massilia sp. BSC265]|uniref:MBOAT family O-acyltransferase n=1 Tax=Massilia sp. BSC265 TaxID=1549812 RepID=UPI0004E90E16|nr:MBOAT family O-acyltransferase [Massilia sp. BSC265]KFI07538.1 alginate O-acetyltransferase [Massilia sp. BSC265]